MAEEEARRPGTVWRAPFGRYCGPYFMARRYARVGQRERALAALEQAYDQRHHMMVSLKREPLFEGLHAEPAFHDLVRRIGVP